MYGENTVSKSVLMRKTIQDLMELEYKSFKKAFLNSGRLYWFYISVIMALRNLLNRGHLYIADSHR